jgi:dTDP-4-dehydrorhamnose reductase
VLAAACASRGVQLLTFSSDLVFDGSKGAPYVESDPVSPLNVYGRSKADAEVRVLRELPAALVVRTSAFFGPWDEYNFVTLALRALAEGRRVPAGVETVSPTYVPDLVNTCLDLLTDGESGIWHLANRCTVTWAELARLAANLAGMDAGLVDEHAEALPHMTARRPAYSALGSERGWLMPPLDSALERYFEACEVEWLAQTRVRHGTSGILRNRQDAKGLLNGWAGTHSLTGTLEGFAETKPPRHQEHQDMK